MFPTNFPTQNTHRVVHFHPEIKSSDFDRIEDIGANALAHARQALTLLPGLYTEAHNALAVVTDRIAAQVAKRRLLTEDARLDLETAVDTCARLLADNGDDAVVAAVGEQLQEALDASHRVADLLAAEESIGWHRGIPSGRNR